MIFKGSYNYFLHRSDLTQTVTETGFTRNNKDENYQSDQEFLNNDSDINAISDTRKR